MLARMGAHLITGGFPAGSHAGHDMDYARERLQRLLEPHGPVSVSSDFADVAARLGHAELLVSYVAGPYPVGEQDEALRKWLAAGGRWVALHGTSGGKAERTGEGGRMRKMARLGHHDTLGSFFLNHPPARRFRVDVADPQHPLARGLPASFEVSDELYLIELLDPACSVLLTTTTDVDEAARGFGFVYDDDTSLLADGKTRALAYTRACGEGAVAYIALGHCHSPETNIQPFVDASLGTDRVTPALFRGPWESEAFEQLLANAIQWGAQRD